MVKNPYNPKSKLEGTSNKVSNKKVSGSSNSFAQEKSFNSGMNSNNSSMYNNSSSEIKYSEKGKGHNPVQARELELFTENDYDVYRQRLEPIYKNLAGKQQKGTYDKEKAIKVYKNAVDDASKKYEREIGTGGKIFSSKDKWEVAKRLEENNREEVQNFL